MYERRQAGRKGLIPARAGNTGGGGGDAVVFGAHPRSRGEHLYAQIKLLDGGGSSPLARGTPEEEPQPVPARGLIPARAGNTTPTMRVFLPWRAHPRSRGEHVCTSVDKPGVRGSSPLARGTLNRHRSGLSADGLIPARAGNTQLNRRGILKNRAHPRSRGEHAYRVIDAKLSEGSSPLARGTLIGLRNDNSALGLIPARAGNTIPQHSCHSTERAHPRSRGEHLPHPKTL